ncbi:MAG: L-threonylcarbamoyladenylate synthase [bacterium]|nr:L-threonylcarbamoyladenylate synthase [bacterium]
MQTIKIDINKIEQEQIDLIVDYLKRGSVIAYPTDTIYGLGCDAGNAEAIEKINKIKGERGNKPFLVLISDFEMLKKYCVVNSEQMEYLKKVWLVPTETEGSGAVTVILENRKNLPAELTGGLDSLAVRLPKNEFLVKMISAAGFPVVSTSLNKTGEPPLNNAQNLENYFDYLPDLVIDAGEGRNIKPSRLVDLRDIMNIKILRE